MLQRAPPEFVVQERADARPGGGIGPQLVFRRTANSPQPPRPPLGQILLEMEAVRPADLIEAIALRQTEEAPLSDILLARGWVSEEDLFTALARQWNAGRVDLSVEPPDPRLIDQVSAETCLAEGIVPWRRIGGLTVIATARPERFARLRGTLPAALGPCRMVLAPEHTIQTAVLAQRRTTLIRRAEIRVSAAESCRTRNERYAARAALMVIAAATLGLWLAPIGAFALLFGWTFLTLIATLGLKFASAFAEIGAQLRGHHPAADPVAAIRLPVISVMVPLLRERDIAGRLVTRLERLDYPRALLDLVLVVEAGDTTTRQALAGATLPSWMRVVTVPDGPIRTKPRALNYALSFCRGTIIGVWDAEDAPDPDQLHIVAQRFARAPAEVVCLQGILDYYNPRTNWLARCFTIEYAAWFRVMLPGLARLGLVVPLGGTTLFFRRTALERLGGWDAHNVTEDADLGLRLARHGYRTELIPTVTQEEANCRALPWIRQRSRWIKGYAMTWAVHMRDPVRLWRQLGTKRFLAVQVLFLGSLSQAILAPVLWSFWLITFGLWHPIETLLSPGLETALLATFISAEALNIGVGIWAVRGRVHRHLILWVPTLTLYFPLAALAGWKALYEVVAKPFYWDKTAHGIYDTPRAVVTPDLTETPAMGAVPERTSRAPLID